MNVRQASLLLALAVPLAACDPDEPPVSDAGTQADGGPVVDTDSGPGEERDAAPPADAGPPNDSFEGARSIGTDGTAATEAIESPGDVDFFRFEGTAGDWVAINVTANPDDDVDMLDSVITLYDAERNQIAANDDGQPRANTDSEIVIHLPSTGTYYIKVEDYSSWITTDDIEPEGDPSYQYELAVAVLAAGGALAIDPEGGDTAAEAAPAAFGGTSGNIAFVLGTFDDASDVDVFSFTAPGTGARLLQAYVMPAGTDGYGSTRAAGRIWLANADGSSIIARISPREAEQLDAMPPIVGGTSYLLFVDAGGGTAGSNDHYALKLIAGTENPDEAEETLNSNDTIADATALVFEEGRAFILASLPEGDVDVFSLEVAEGETVSVYCGAESSGSGLRGLSAKLLAADETELASATPETATTGASISRFAPTAAGTYYLQLSAASRDAEVAGDFVRCVVVVAAPAAP